MNVNFLSPPQAHVHLKGLYINRGCTATHHNNVMEFSVDDKSLLLKLMKTVENLFSQHLFHVGKIDFIQLRSGTYWDFPFTVGKSCIIVTPVLLKKRQSEIIKILAHELVHLDQKRNYQKYQEYYLKLGFQRAHIEFGYMEQYILRNPDGDVYEWIYPVGKKIYVPLALLIECKFKVVLLEVQNSLTLNYNISQVKAIHNVSDISRYYSRFGTKKQLYHPNEITAHLIADYIIDKKQYVPIDYLDIMNLLNS